MAMEVIVHVRYVGGPWDGQELDVPLEEVLFGKRIQAPYSEELEATIGRKPPPQEPLPQTHMSIYRYDESAANGVLYCRFEKSIPLEEWKKRDRTQES